MCARDCPASAPNLPLRVTGNRPPAVAQVSAPGPQFRPREIGRLLRVLEGVTSQVLPY
jgi:hypothetical protein